MPRCQVVDFALSTLDNRTVNLFNTGVSFIPVALAVTVGVFFALAGILAVFVVIVVANRAEPDPSGERPTAVYLFAVSFFSMFIVLFGTFAMVLGLVQLIGSHPVVSNGAKHPVGDAVVRVVVLGAIIVAVAAFLLATSLRRALANPEVANRQAGPVGRVAQSYAASVSFAAVFIAAVSLVVFLYQAFSILAPGVFELSTTRVAAARTLLAALYLSVASVVVVAVHARLLPGGRRPMPYGAPVDPGYAPPAAPTPF